jgi:methionine synthase II (cobalamin-independent)
MLDKTLHFNFAATGIGSVPFQNIKDTCRDILEHLPAMPFWPQFVKRSYLEDMTIQFSEGLPLLEIIEKKRSLAISSAGNPESELVTFYEHFLAQDTDYFAVSRTYAPGLYALLELINRDPTPGPYIKGQTIGPVTFAAGITDVNGNSVLHNPELLEAMVRGLAIKALWQVQTLASSGKKAMIFLDEPYLSGFGSAFSSIQRHEVIDLLRTVIRYLKENSDVLVGIHCCGNTDWSMIAEACPDIISFDAFEYMDYFLLYPDDIIRFIREGGTLAWGIVPTTNFTGDESEEELYSRLEGGLNRIYEWGIEPEMLSKRSILTPACGMGTMAPEAARKDLDLLSQLSKKLRQPTAASSTSANS